MSVGDSFLILYTFLIGAALVVDVYSICFGRLVFKIEPHTIVLVWNISSTVGVMI